jgi:hypothetical protein
MPINEDIVPSPRRRRGPRGVVVASATPMHDVVALAYDDWDDIWQPNRTVRKIVPGLSDQEYADGL